jgi:hypothetical protein
LRGDVVVTVHGRPRRLDEALADSDLPNAAHSFAAEQDCAVALKPSAPRRYSIAYEADFSPVRSGSFSCSGATRC